MPQETMTITDDTFTETVLASKLPVVVDFWAEWCPSCKVIATSLIELAGELDGQLLITKLNSDENPQVTRAYQVMSLPTLLVFRDGQVVGSIVGSKPKNQLRQALIARAGL